jgi:glutathione S-transferase
MDQPSGEHNRQPASDAEFVAINPKGLVPVPVHDGVVLTESSDIIDYLDRHFPNPPLRPSDPDRNRTLVSLVKALGRNSDLAEDPVSQYDLKGRAAGMRAQMGKLEALVKNDELVEFMREFTSANGLSKDPPERATGWIERVPGELDERLAGIHGLPATPSRSPTSPGASISIDSS